MAPEIVKMEQYDQSCDIWSLGVIIYNLFLGKLPFNGKDLKELQFNIVNEELEYNESDWGGFSADALDFIKKCLIRDPKERPSADVLLNHAWFQMKMKRPDRNITMNTKMKVVKSIEQFKEMTDLQKTIISLLCGFAV